MIIIRVFEEWRFELKNSFFFVEVITNHKNLEYFMSIKQFNRRQTRWSEFLSRFNYQITYRSNKIDDKSNVLTRRSKDFFKKKNTQNFRHLYQHQIVLKFHVLNFKILNLQCKMIVLNSIQLHLFSFQFSQSIILILMNLNIEKSDVEIDDSKFQLNSDIFAFDNDFVDVFIQTLWNQIEARDIFELRILKALRNDDRYHNKIPFVECEERNNTLYFRDRKYVFNSNSLRFRVIQLVHDSVTNEHSERVKTYKFVNRIY